MLTDFAFLLSRTEFKDEEISGGWILATHLFRYIRMSIYKKLETI